MKIKLNEQKNLEFNIDTSGCSWEDLNAYLRFTFDNVEYGFKADVKENSLTINVPPFADIISESLVESVSKNKEIIVEGRLDVVAEDNKILTPWKGEVEIEIPVSIKVQKNIGGIRDIIEASKDIVTVKDPKVTTVSTAKNNPEPFDKVLKTAKQDADRKAKEVARQEKKKEKSRLGSVLMGNK